MRLKDLESRTVKVAVIPSAPDRLLVKQKDGSFKSQSVERFIAEMVDTIRREARNNG